VWADPEFRCQWWLVSADVKDLLSRHLRNGAANEFPEQQRTWAQLSMQGDSASHHETSLLWL